MVAFLRSSVTSSTDSALLDARVEMLTSPYRRRVLLAVSERGRFDEGTLAREMIGSVASADADPDRLRTELLHSHLPRLADGGYVAWDPDTGEVRPGPDLGAVEALLRAFVGADGRR